MAYRSSGLVLPDNYLNKFKYVISNVKNKDHNWTFYIDISCQICGLLKPYSKSKFIFIINNLFGSNIFLQKYCSPNKKIRVNFKKCHIGGIHYHYFCPRCNFQTIFVEKTQQEIDNLLIF